jgi:hypothetical protein
LTHLTNFSLPEGHYLSNDTVYSFDMDFRGGGGGDKTGTETAVFVFNSTNWLIGGADAAVSKLYVSGDFTSDDPP